MNMSMLSNSVSGLMQTMYKLQQNAQQIASSSAQQSGASSLTTMAVSQQQLLMQAEADVKTVSTADQMLGTVIDTRA